MSALTLRQFINQSSPTAGSTSSATSPFGGSLAVGSVIIVAFELFGSTFPGTISGVSDTAGNSYNLLSGPQVGSTAGDYYYLYYAQNTHNTASNAITVSYSATNHPTFFTACATEWTGQISGNPVDQLSAWQFTSSPSLSWTGNPVTTQQTNEEILGFVVSNAAGDPNPTGTNGFSSVGGTSNSHCMYASEAAIGTYTPSATFSPTTSDYSSITLSVKSLSSQPSPSGSKINWMSIHRDFVNKRGLH
jgi:hypothetical protein